MKSSYMHISVWRSGSCIWIRGKKELHKPFHDKSSMTAFFESSSLCQKEKPSGLLSPSVNMRGQMHSNVETAKQKKVKPL